MAAQVWGGRWRANAEGGNAEKLKLGKLKTEMGRPRQAVAGAGAYTIILRKLDLLIRRL